MSNIIEQINQDTLKNLNVKRPEFSPGDTVKVNVRISEGGKDRIQAFEGVVIAKKNDGLNSSFTVRKVLFGEGVERVFPLFGPVVADIEVVRRGDVRRAKLYYLRGLTGKAARITEKSDWSKKTVAADEVAEEAAAAEHVEAAELTAETPAEESVTEETAVEAVEGEKKPEASATASA